MDALPEFLQRHLPKKLGTVLHLGAGARALDLYTAFETRRLVLVEGDPDTFSELEISARAGERAVEVIGEVVMPSEGTVHWRRFSVRAHNGPLPRDALLAYYPRLRQWTSSPRPGCDVAALLAKLDISRGAGLPNVLVLDTPGQAEALVRRVPAEALQSFDWLVIIEYRTGLDPARGGDDPLAPLLLEASFVAADPCADDTSGPWSVQAWHFDHQRHELSKLRQQLHEAAEREAAAEQRSEMLHQQALTQAQDWQAQLNQARSELQSALVERDEARSRSATLDAELSAARSALVLRQRDQDAQLARIAELTAERDREAHWHKENASWARSLDAKSKEQQSQLEDARRELQLARNESTALRDAETAIRAELAKANAESAESEARQRNELGAARDRLSAVSKERDEQSRAHQESSQKAQSLQKELDTLKQQLARALDDKETTRRQIAERDARQALLDQEVLRAEAQLDLIKDVLLREKNF